MQRIKKIRGYFLTAAAIGVALALGACASIGRPGGGPRDEAPPQFVRSNPMPGERNVDRRTINIYFDENIQLDDAFNKVVVSPVQSEAARVSSNGRRVTVRLSDTLVANTTYTIDFADAIKDLNEGNILDGFALDFSTGEIIDSLRISGIVLAASNLEPAQGMVVAAYSNLSDTAIRTVAPARIARTNQLGQFTLRNLAPGTYRIYAFNDINRDWRWDRTEDVAFLDSLVVPDVREISLTDTLYSSSGADSLIARKGVQYLPNDLLLTWFNEGYISHYLKNYSRPERRKINFKLSAPPDSLPEIRIVDGPSDTTLRGALAERWSVAEFNQKNDSLTFWLSDTVVAATDSLRLSIKYLRTDTADRLTWRTDTLRLFYRDPKKSKKEMEADTLPRKYDVLTLALASGSSQDVNKPLTLRFSQPLAKVDTAAIRLEILEDTLWKPQPPVVLRPDSLNPVLGVIIENSWKPGSKYRLSVDSAAITGIFDEHNKAINQEFSVKALEEYSNLFLTVTGADSTAIVELLGTSDQLIMRAPVVGDKAEFRYVAPGTYYARMFFDSDGNGEWTTGILDSIQPEEVAYYPAKLELKRNWDIEQTWDIYATAIDRQKPYAILKNRPALKKGEKAPVEEDMEDDDPFADPWMNTGNRNNLNNRNNGNNRTNKPSGPVNFGNRLNL